MYFVYTALGLICGLAAGYLLGKAGPASPKKKSAAAADPRAAARARKEYENFLTYDGSVQEDILP